MASSINVGAFNLGNALGAAAGGRVLSQQLGYAAVSYTGAGLAGLGLLFGTAANASGTDRAFSCQTVHRLNLSVLRDAFLLLYFYCFTFITLF